jgi:PAS domain S-box-containing protein
MDAGRRNSRVAWLDERGIIMDVADHSGEIREESEIQPLRSPILHRGKRMRKGMLRCGGAIMVKSNVKMLVGNEDHRPSHVLALCPADLVERFSTLLLDRVRLGIVLLDERERVLEMNRAASEYLGMDNSLAQDRPVGEVLSLLDAGREEQERFISFVRTSWEEPRRMEIQWKGKGNIRYLSIEAQSIQDEERGLKGQVLLIENMTDMRSLELQVRRNDRLATIGQIAAGTAHEIRNPLTAIKGFLQVIGHRLKENGQKKEQGYIEIMLKEISRINHLVGEFLLLSKPRRQHLHTVNVAKVLREILPIIKNEALLHNIGVVIEKKLSTLPVVHADGELLKQVFLNLCKNAIEAMEDGGMLTIRLMMDEAEKKLVVDIADAGPGIPLHALDKIFEPFFTTKENGTGLGLPICRQILNEFGGRIEVATSEMGTTFSVHMPLALS